MSKLYLQNIVDDISFDNLPVKWQGFSAESGSASGGKDNSFENLVDSIL